MLRALQPEDQAALRAFLARIPDEDRTFFEEDVADPAIVERWLADGRGRRSLALDGERVVGYAAVRPRHGWSRHVGDLRLVVDPERRRQGVGRALARRTLLEALELELEKVVVEVVADQQPAVRMFEALGFEAEALLRDQVRDRDGDLRDLLVLAHRIRDTWAGMQAAGLDEAVR